MDLIGEVGGFNGSFLLIFDFFLSYYAPTLFMQSLVKSIFQVDLFVPRKNSRGRKGVFKQVYGTKRPALEMVDDSISNSISRLLSKLANKPSDSFSQLSKRISLGETDIQNLLDLLLRRKKLSSSTFKAFCGQNFSCLRGFFRTESLKGFDSYKKGAEKVECSLEVSQLIKVQQDVQVIQNTLFTRRQ